MNKVEVIFIEKEFSTSGHSPFLATCNDAKKYVVKHDRGKELCIINEFLACFLLEHFNLPFSNYALVNVDDLVIQNSSIISPKNKKLSYYKSLCFGSEFLKNAVDINNFGLDYGKSFFDKLDNPLDILRIALFDIWVGNDDRKPTNYNMLLVENSKKYKAVPIDHSFIFETLSHSFLNPDFFEGKINDHLLEANFGYLVKKQFEINERFIESEENYFLVSLAACQKHFSNFASKLQNQFHFSDKDITKISLFLFDETRNRKVFEEYKFHLKN
ncbi:HipA family kinase [Bernardetia sp. MNP-M8]|uniref:HipA family kinase n=1 Tax=Bernardetia sp. MNP-M8 TaxID=3127470 RepID=UPI0030CEA5C4